MGERGAGAPSPPGDSRPTEHALRGCQRDCGDFPVAPGARLLILVVTKRKSQKADRKICCSRSVTTRLSKELRPTDSWKSCSLNIYGEVDSSGNGVNTTQILFEERPAEGSVVSIQSPLSAPSDPASAAASASFASSDQLRCNDLAICSQHWTP
ncbi:uncharacterized protein LOC143642624 [Tamandua tetradactyla]|uniref:uncharacterized protein LOC143642624 n=1 Tax=Tamandua tetradactyla TaxID=48850 RepID=UPI0040547D22